MTPADTGAALRVLQSTPRPSPRTNPYIVQLHAALRAAGVEVVPFSWQQALLGRYDVLHTHWPEILVRGRGPLRTLLRQALTVLLVARLTLTRTPVVRTRHNLQPHEDLSRSARVVMGWLEARETGWVRLNVHTPVPDLARTVLAPLGDYVAWAEGRHVPATVPGRVVAPGVVRAYKGLDELVAAFALVDTPGASLHVVGRSEDPELAARLEHAAGTDPRIELTLHHVDDDRLAGEVGEAQVVVLPYRAIHNSSAALLALSLNRPVLVPRAPVTEQLARTIGTSWVLVADTADPAALARAITDALVATQRAPTDAPDLSGHDWTDIAAVHVLAYRAAGERRRSTG